MAERKVGVLSEGRALAEDLDACLKAEGSFSQVFANVEGVCKVSELVISKKTPFVTSKLLVANLFIIHHFKNQELGSQDVEAELLKSSFEEWRVSVINGDETDDNYVKEVVSQMNLSTVLISTARRLALYKSKLDWGVTDEFEQREYQRLLQIRNTTRIAADL